jgi:hypothetical protein
MRSATGFTKDDGARMKDEYFSLTASFEKPGKANANDLSGVNAIDEVG